MELQNDTFYGFMAINYMEEKDYKNADRYFQKADNMRMVYCNTEGYGTIYRAIIKKYDEIFQDQFAGDFGHCWDFSNLLIAKNVAVAFEEITNIRMQKYI